MNEVDRAVCYYHVDGEPVLEREHGGAMTVLATDQKYTDWGAAWVWYVRVWGGPWTKVAKPKWASS